MSDPVLASIIAACATIFTALLQLKAAFTREVAARASSGSRRKSRAPAYLLVILLGAAGVGGFALAKWASEDERAEQAALRQELQERITEVSRTAVQLETTRDGARAEMEAGIMRRLGAEGAAVTAVVPACKTPVVVGNVQVPSDVPAAIAASTCTESDASPIQLCVNIPASAHVSNVAVYARTPDSDVPWNASLVAAGQEIDRARFAETPVEIKEGDATKQVCQTFVNWAADRSRIARMVVRYTF